MTDLIEEFLLHSSEQSRYSTVGDYEVGLLDGTIPKMSARYWEELYTRQEAPDASNVDRFSEYFPENMTFQFSSVGFAVIAFIDYVQKVLPTVLIEVEKSLNEIVETLIIATRWSARTLADLLGTSHPTIRAIAENRLGSGTRSPDLLLRLQNLEALTMRILPLVDNDPRRLEAVFRAGTPSVKELIETGEYGGAYLAAIDAIIPRHVAGESLKSFSFVQAGEANSPLTD